MPVAFLNVAAETPEPDQGEMDERPNPAPSANKPKLAAVEATAPAEMLAQETSDIEYVDTELSVRMLSTASSPLVVTGSEAPNAQIQPRD